MCYSVRIRARLKELAAEFGAEIDLDLLREFFSMRLKKTEWKLPHAIDLYCLGDNSLSPLIRQFHSEEKDRLIQKLIATELELKELLAGRLNAAAKKKIEVRERRRLTLKEKIEAPLERLDPLAERVFPFSFAPVILEEKGRRQLRLMRYRVLPTNGQEIPSSYNVFNARRDSLLSAQTWRPLFGKSHAIFPFQSFYEWVEGPGGKPRELRFHPEGRELMWAASLYAASKDLYSFAMVTDEPPPEVAAAGHDRCPVFLEKSRMDSWLQAALPKDQLLALLDHKENAYYQNQPAA